MANMPAASVPWVQKMNQRLELARKVHKAVDTGAKVAQKRRAALPPQTRREPSPMKPGDYCYY